MGGRVVEGTGLENQQGCKLLVGSNPTPSTKREAKIWAEQIESLDRSGKLPGIEAERTTLAEALGRYKEEVTPSKKGASVEAYLINAWLRDPLVKRTLTEIRSTDIAAWRDQEVKKCASPSSVRNRLNIISHCYRIARTEWGMEVTNPVKGVRMPKQRPGRDRRLEPGEFEKIRLACGIDPNPWIGAVFVILLETGMRLGELLNLERKQIMNGMIHLREGETKTDSARSIPLSSRAKAAVAALPACIDGRVIGCGKDTIEHAWRRVCEIATVEDLRLHDLRHEFTSRMFEKGMDMMQVASLTGHKSLAMLQRYTHLRTANLASMMD